MAFFVLGNFIATNEILYDYVDELTPFLVQALNDTISKIRSHAVSKFQAVDDVRSFVRGSSRCLSTSHIDTLGFLARHRLSDRLIELKVPEKLLDVACHDTHVIVQEFAMRVLKQMLKHPKAKDVIRTVKASALIHLSYLDSSRMQCYRQALDFTHEPMRTGREQRIQRRRCTG